MSTPETAPAFEHRVSARGTHLTTRRREATPEALVAAVADDYDPEGLLAAAALRRLSWRLSRIGGKRCGECEQELPLSAFSHDSSKADGVRSKCRACDAAARKRKRDIARAQRG